MSGPGDDGPSRQSMERAGIRSGGSVGLRIGLGLGGAAVVAAAVALLWPRGEPAPDADAGSAEDAGPAFRPIEIGMPVIIARSGGSPASDEGAAPGAPAPRRAGTREAAGAAPGEPVGGTGAPPPEPWQDPAAATATDEAPPPWQAGSPPAEPPPSRTIAADDSPAGQAAAMAYQVSARSAVQRQYLGHVQGCFDQAASADPTLSGSITMGFVMADDGRVLSSRVINDTTGRGVGACVAAAARAWRLPPPPRNALEMQMTFAL